MGYIFLGFFLHFRIVHVSSRALCCWFDHACRLVLAIEGPCSVGGCCCFEVIQDFLFFGVSSSEEWY